LPQWILEQAERNKDIWIYWHHLDLFSSFSQSFWDELIVLSEKFNFKIYIICSPCTFFNSSNDIIVKLFSQTLKDKGVVRLFRSIQNWNEKDNDMLVSDGNTFITDADSGRRGAAFFWEHKINAACRKTIDNHM